MKFTPYLQFLPALMLGLLGLGAIVGGRAYRTGTLTGMGPGFMPVALGLCLLLLGGALAWNQRGERFTLPLVPMRPVVCVGGGMLLWVLLADSAGFLPAAAAQLLLSSLALPLRSWPGLLAGVLVFALATYVLFVSLLGLPLPAFGN